MSTSMADTSTTPRQHAVVVCSPGMGHLIPSVELAKRFSSLQYHPSFKTTILFVTTQADRSSTAGVLIPPSVDLVPIEAADISDLVDPSAQVVTKIFVLMRHTQPAIRAAISGLTAPEPTVLVFDMFAAEYASMGRDFGLPSFVYVPASAWFLALSVYCPVLDKEVQGEYVDQPDPLKIPGCKPVRPDDVVDPMMDRTDAQYNEYLKMGLHIPMFDGVLSNTWLDLESSTVAALRDDALLRGIIRAPVYDIGPLVRTLEPGPGRDDPNKISKNKGILDWLDRQPHRSVLYVSFGSGGTLSTAQMAELAWGLEMSHQRFVWVVRPPTVDGEASGSYFGAKGNGDDDDMGKYNLPDGFLERTCHLGLLVPQWAPQLEILSHKSVGGFLTHCGWNSAMESITNGVPMIAWPMYAEQKMNARMMVEDLGVAIMSRELPGKKVVGRDEIENMTRRVLEGEEGTWMRRRVMDLQKSGVQAQSEIGSSYNCFAKFIQSTLSNVQP